MWKPIISLLFAIVLVACEAPPTEVHPTFYHWKSTFAPSQYGGALLDQLQPRAIYVRFFDIDWDASSKQAVPVGDVDLGALAVYEIPVVPTVFITNRTLQNLATVDLPVLGRRLYDRIAQKAKKASLPSPTMIQLDCDWTAGTRAAFFGLLQAMRQQAGPNVAFSSTIRLHQVRDRDRMGIPPVDRGMLMYYNMGDLENWEEPNSILNLQKAQPYLSGLEDYPLQLDLALPVYAWGLVFREERFLQIINDLRPETLADTSRFQKIDSNRYVVRKSTYLDGSYIYQGDAIRVEAITPEQITAATAQLKPYFKHKTFDLAFYHLDSTNITTFDHVTLEQICRQMEQ